MKQFQNPSQKVVNDGIQALDLIGDTVSDESLMKASAMLEQNFGKEYPIEKFQMLFQMIRDENWTDERFKRTLKWFLKTKYNQAWTIADWFQYEGVKLYPYAWYLEQVSKLGAKANSQIECYELSENPKIIGYRFADGETLPFKYLGIVAERFRQ